MKQKGREVVVITGATAGVGRATAREFARRGACVGVIARGHDGLKATCEEIERLGGIPLPLRVDVANAEEVFDAAERVEDTLGPIDVWVNNAMTTVFAPVEHVTPEEFRRVTDVTYHGQVHGTMAALRVMRRRDRGHVVSVGSALAFRGIPLQAAYCGAKHAIRGFLDSVRSELIHNGESILVTEVHLPAMNTPQFDWCESRMDYHPQPVPPIYQPEVAARAVYYAAHHRRRQIYVGYPTYQTILGNKVAPGFLDHFLATKAWSGQMTEQPAQRDRPSNLFEPVSGDHGAHGQFDDQSSGRSPLTQIGMRLGAPQTARWAASAAAVALLAYGAKELVARL